MKSPLSVDGGAISSTGSLNCKGGIMAELNLKQITDKLNAEFAGDTRKLVFWYDEKVEFVDDIDTLELSGAKVYHLEPDNQFYTKYFLERVDQETSYLIYAPFAKPSERENHLKIPCYIQSNSLPTV